MEDKKDSFFNNEKLNLVLAFCAILISAASFYATYIQADAAEKQVKVMTMPLFQITTGNYDVAAKVKKITIDVVNSGVGPGLIKNVTYIYNDKRYSNYEDVLLACCLLPGSNKNDIYDSNLLTSSLKRKIISGNEVITHISVIKSDDNSEFWDKLNIARRKINVEICYCSMLDECFSSSRTQYYQPVKQCPTIIE